MALVLLASVTGGEAAHPRSRRCQSRPVVLRFREIYPDLERTPTAMRSRTKAPRTSEWTSGSTRRSKTPFPRAIRWCPRRLLGKSTRSRNERHASFEVLGVGDDGLHVRRGP